ncbi:hypothetical protein [Poriferisphaera sp. WC338]|uniref:hypothetical protein n=1 Tax=Poriferisphaera sp. WC338 TaxID=3425129 RepID=UPI003D81874E
MSDQPVAASQSKLQLPEGACCTNCKASLANLSWDAVCSTCGLPNSISRNAQFAFTKRDLSTLFIRLLCIWLMIKAVAGLSTMIASLFNALSLPEEVHVEPLITSLVSSITGAIITGTVAVLVFALAGLISKIMIQKNDIASFGRGFTFANISALFVLLFGIWVAIEGMMTFTYATVSTIMQWIESSQYYIERDELLVAGALQFCIGLALVFTRNWIVSWLAKSNLEDHQ